MRSYERAQSVLTEHVDVLHKLAEQLLEKETILGAELDEIIRQVRPGIQLPEKPTDKGRTPGRHRPTSVDGHEAEAADATVNQPDDSQSDPAQETAPEENTGPQ
jgi:cell division protease FtsH